MLPSQPAQTSTFYMRRTVATEVLSTSKLQIDSKAEATDILHWLAVGRLCHVLRFMSI